MGEVLPFNVPPQRNLYIVDDFRVILAHSSQEAIQFVQHYDETDKDMDVLLVNDDKEVSVIKSGKVEVILWERQPKPLEQLNFKLKVREFIDTYLKRFSVPSSIDVLEDRGAIRPKK